MTELLRVYAPEECHPAGERRRGWSLTGYPFAWSECPHCGGDGDEPWTDNDVCGPAACSWCDRAGSIKDLVRWQAGERCVRCGHPFIVGESGVMEGPSHEAKATAAQLGKSVEVLDLALSIVEADLPVDGNTLAKARRTNWSDCDERCTHGGPLRVREPGGEWIRQGDWEAARPQAEQGHAANVEVQAAWRILTVHHLNENKADCRWWNLAALCQRCHLEIQGKVNMAQVWPHEHSEWFRPYAAGFYAATYLGEELDREQTMARLDELLALERMGAPA